MPPLEPGHSVILDALPPGLLSGLPAEDREAILLIVGHPVTLVGFSSGQAELEFVDRDGDSHTIWVERAYLRAA